MKIRLLYRNVCKLPSKTANNDEIASNNINFGESTEMSPNAEAAIKQPPESLELKMSQMLTVGHRGAGCS